MEKRAFRLCQSLNGSCSCLTSKRPPCETLLDLVEHGLSEGHERKRMADDTMEYEL